MNKRTVSLITALLCAMASVSWGQSYWKRIYNESPGGSNAYAITPTSDGNFIIVGSTIMKITPFGDSLWAKSYGWTKSYGVIASAITPTPDGNFIVAGYTFSFDNTSRKVYLLKITTNGDTLWTKTYGGNGVAGGNSITPTSDGNFIVVGYTNSFSAGDSCVYLLKITANGDTLWTKTFGENDKESGNAIAPTLDNNFIVAGCTGAFGYDVYLLKVTLNGDTLWTKTYSNSVGGGNAIQPTSDGDDIIVEGYITGSVGLLKIKSNGDTVWTKFIGVYDIVNFASDYYTVSSYSVIPTVDGKFIVTGSFASVHQPGPPVAYILKINSKGEMLWSKTYSPYENEARAVAPTLDGNFIVTGIGDFFGGIMCLYIINDRYTQKDSLFTFKIPVSDDSLNYTFSPIKVPFGMTVSQGGTIS